MNARATEQETRFLDHIDALSAVMTNALAEGDTDTLHDALTESLFAERALAVSRESTWGIWYSQVMNAHKEVA